MQICVTRARPLSTHQRACPDGDGTTIGSRRLLSTARASTDAMYRIGMAAAEDIIPVLRGQVPINQANRIRKRTGDEIQSPSTVMAKEGAGRGIVGAITLGAESGVAAFHCCISLAGRRRRRGQRGFRRPGTTAPLANPRRAIDPSASRTQPRLKRSGWKHNFISPTSFMGLPALRGAPASVSWGRKISRTVSRPEPLAYSVWLWAGRARTRHTVPSPRPGRHRAYPLWTAI